MTSDYVTKPELKSELKRSERKTFGQVALMIGDSEKRLTKLIKLTKEETIEVIKKSTAEMVEESQKKIAQIIANSQKETVELITQSKKETVAEIIGEISKAQEEDAAHRFSHSRINDDLNVHEVRIRRLEKVS
ncbi:MAG: hypothetical protein A3D24_01235 [Candidatus Blackburnbacteria bacterium RIFCSPHIGHO2_02_FULL_39_13]|nr:MAG: hypothetical protein A3D24_01235 [Candidatus Blackburnbacteria bacterium RIFCSPHIGHO2_02_FULL_39_13]OGY15227.1 MAG: hypothetical protein A3I52_00140 [Candidatus Blackburnbacteria bacterium RIFCSPLOWO2_02_FULL_40_10]